MMGTSLTADQVEIARELRRRGKSWKAIGRALNRNSDTARRAIDPVFRKHRNHKVNVAQKERLAGTRVQVLKIDVPAHVWAERERRLAADISLTAMLCGDPRPGQSALDRR